MHLNAFTKKTAPWALAGLSASLLLASPVRAIPIDEIGLLVGDSKHADMMAMVLTQDTRWSWFASPKGRLQAYWQADISGWKGKGVGGKNLTGIGLAPVFRYTGAAQGAVRPYVEGAIGAHYFSGVRLSNAKRMGTRFEFGDHVGVGLAIGEKPGLDIAYRFQHFSNASISNYNEGVDFHQVQLRMRF